MAIGAAIGAAAGAAHSAISGEKSAREAAKAQKKSAKTAAEAQVRAAELASETQLSMFREGQAATAPWRAAGQEALGALGDIYGVRTATGIDKETGEATGFRDPSYARALERFQTSPGYQFQIDEAQKASDRAASAGGRFSSGSQLRALQGIAQNTANLEFGRYTQGLQSLAGVGQSSAGQTAAQATGVGQGIGANYMAAGQAQAASALASGQASAAQAINSANIQSNFASQAAQIYGQYQGSQQQPQQQPVQYGGGISQPTSGYNQNQTMVA